MRATDEDPIRQTTYGRNYDKKALVNTTKGVGRPRGVWANEASRIAWKTSTEKLREEDTDPGFDSQDEEQHAELHLRAQLFLF